MRISCLGIKKNLYQLDINLESYKLVSCFKLGNQIKNLDFLDIFLCLWFYCPSICFSKILYNL